MKSETMSKFDRLSYLNSLKFFIDKLREREMPLRILLADVFGDPNKVLATDVNALMLANLLVRRYNKELNLDIELTPEEVLLVEEGLEKKLVHSASRLIDGYQEIFLLKIMAVQKMLKDSLDRSLDDSLPDALSTRTLLTLEREIHLFFSLVGGKTAVAVMRIALKQYGDPDAEIYHLSNSAKHMAALLQHLRVVIRGFGRVGCLEDLPLFQRVKKRELDFAALNEKTITTIPRIMELIDLSIQKIQQRGL